MYVKYAYMCTLCKLMTGYRSETLLLAMDLGNPAAANNHMKFQL